MKFTYWTRFLYLLILCYISGCISQKCGNTNSTRPLHCCKNHEEINGTCLECKIGYISDMGEPCHECPQDTYGLKCLNICRCEATESCHHIKGCISEAETAMIVEKELMTALSKSHRVTYGTSFPMTSVTNGERISETKNENNDLTRVTSANENSFVDGQLKTDVGGILTYSICTGGLTCIVLFLLCIYRYQYSLCKSNRQRRAELENRIVQSNFPVPNESDGDLENVYEMIDESKMLNYPFEMACINIEDTASNASKHQDS